MIEIFRTSLYFFKNQMIQTNQTKIVIKMQTAVLRANAKKKRLSLRAASSLYNLMIISSL
jgi:hypothetical protein